jgi:hypothetical protein
MTSDRLPTPLRLFARFMLACNEVGFWPRMTREERLWWRRRAL